MSDTHKPNKKTQKQQISTRKTKRKTNTVALIKNFNEGNLLAFVEIYKTHSNLVTSVAKRYQNQGLDLGELTLFGKIGLLKAVHRYNEDKNIHFRSYAIWWIKQSIFKALQEHARITQIPEALIINLGKILQRFHAVEQASNHEPDCEIDDIVELKIQELISLIK